MYAIPVFLNRVKQGSGNALGSLALVIAGKHPVDIGVVHGPKTLSHVHGIAVDAGNHQNLVIRHKFSTPLHLPQRLNQAGTDIHLLHLIAADAAHYGAGMFAGSKAEPLQRKLLPVWRIQRI